MSDVERSKQFYSALLRGLGWGGVLEAGGERGEPIWYLQAADTWLGLREKQSDAHPVPYDRYAVGVHHIAFEADSRARVEEIADWLRAQGVELESEPQEYTYMPGYYAVFFYDPDGIKLEIVHVPGLVAA